MNNNDRSWENRRPHAEFGGYETMQDNHGVWTIFVDV